MQHYTTIEQSKRLLELGLNSESADMVYIMFNDKPLDDDIKLSTVFENKDHKWYWIDFIDGSWNICKEDIYCWSLGALLEIMPEIDNQLPSLRKYKNYYCVVYSDITTRLGDRQWQNGKTPAEAAYNMVVWLLENGYLNNEKVCK